MTVFISFLDCTANVTLIGNGVCNYETNNPGCFYDGGDCCVNANTNHCTDCICYHKENCAAGFTPSIVGDGFCNDGTNNADCNYDGGDCCGYDVNTGYCSDCKCYLNETCIAGTHPLVGDGFCNDKTNNANCDYDGGDCCKSNLKILNLCNFLFVGKWRGGSSISKTILNVLK